MHTPTFKLERELRARGYRMIAGIDEVGCGALAGPVVAAAVILPLDSRLGLIRDSKLLSSDQRTRLLPALKKKLTGYGIGEAAVGEINALGLRRATLLAMRRAYEALLAEHTIDFVLIDAWSIPELVVPQRAVIHGDRLVKSIAAASIVAKVYRDRLMMRLAEHYPGYGFEAHKGYATSAHRACLRKLGPCPFHRKLFAPVQELDPVRSPSRRFT